MIQDDMIREVQELKLAGYTPVEVHAELAKRHKKAPTIKTVRNYLDGTIDIIHSCHTPLDDFRESHPVVYGTSG